MKKTEHQLEIYHTLNVLMEELDEGKFKEQLDAFTALYFKILHSTLPIALIKRPYESELCTIDKILIKSTTTSCYISLYDMLEN